MVGAYRAIIINLQRARSTGLCVQLRVLKNNDLPEDLLPIVDEAKENT